MVYKSKCPDVVEAGTGIIQFIFSNKNNVPEDKKILIDALNLDNYLTYAQLKDNVLKLAGGLQDICGFQQDDVLALYSHNQVSQSQKKKSRLNALV
jgi:long-subunit acyl-CoA synthetase (AMP-forming)